MPQIKYGIAFRFAQELAFRKGYSLDKTEDNQGYVLEMNLNNGRKAIRFFDLLEEVADCLETGQLMLDYFFVNHTQRLNDDNEIAEEQE